MVLPANGAGQGELGHDIKRLHGKDEQVQGREHFRGRNQTAFGGDIRKQARNVHRDEGNDHLGKRHGYDALHMAERLIERALLGVRHADAKYKREHQRSHDAEHRGDFQCEKRRGAV